MIENPQPAWLQVLLLALPGILFAACALNEHIFPRDDRPLCTIPALAIVLALLPTHVLALAFGSLSGGLAVAWSSVGAAGYVWIVRHWRELRSAMSVDHGRWVRKVGVAGLATLPIVLPTILLNFYDEAYFNGHHAMIAHLQNGTYPPRYLYEPSLPLRYHYAFDLAGAIVTGLLRVRPDHAIDLLTLTLWPCMFLLLWRVGEHVGGARAGLLVALGVCFSGSWCTPCTIHGLAINPPFISYFFQHPWGIGIPIFCLVVLQRAALPRVPNQPLALAALVCSLLLLSFSQVALFVVVVAALGLIEAWRLVRLRDYAPMKLLLALGASLLCARLMGGFFISGNYPSASGLLGSGFYLQDFSSADAVFAKVQWNLVNFGLLMIVGIFGLRRTSHEGTFLTVSAVLCFFIVNLVQYNYTWDTQKFSTVISIILAIGVGVALSNLNAWADTRIRRLTFYALATALFWQGAYYAFGFAFAYNSGTRAPFSIQMIRPYLSRAYPLSQDAAQAVTFLRTHIGPEDIVYRATEKSEPYAIWGGLPTQASVFPADNHDNDSYGLGQKKFAARRELGTISETWFDRLSAQHVAWVVTDAADFGINSILDSPEGQGRGALAAQYSDIRIFRIH